MSVVCNRCCSKQSEAGRQNKRRAAPGEEKGTGEATAGRVRTIGRNEWHDRTANGRQKERKITWYVFMLLLVRKAARFPDCMASEHTVSADHLPLQSLLSFVLFTQILMPFQMRIPTGRTMHLPDLQMQVPVAVPEVLAAHHDSARPVPVPATPTPVQVQVPARRRTAATRNQVRTAATRAHDKRSSQTQCVRVSVCLRSSVCDTRGKRREERASHGHDTGHAHVVHDGRLDARVACPVILCSPT